MTLAALLALASELSSVPNVTPVEEFAAVFSDICVNAEDGAESRKKAAALEGASPSSTPSERMSPYDKAYRYKLMKVGVYGYRDAPACFVAAPVDPALTPEAFETVLGPRFSMNTHLRKEGAYYRSLWTKGRHAYMAELGIKDGRLVALLSLRNR